MDFLRLNFLDAKLPARCFLGPAKGGCLPPSGTQIKNLSAGLRLKTKGTKKTLEPLVKSIQKDQAEKHKKSTRCVGEPYKVITRYWRGGKLKMIQEERIKFFSSG
jgi:hypothetical protein